jgi:hypothetical protein
MNSSRFWLPSRRLGTLPRIVALLVLATVVADLGNASCDPIPRPNDQANLFSPQPAQDDDPCAAFCVPDCFCCSSLLVTGSVLLIADARPLEGTPSAPAERVSFGVSPIPYHPPRLLL